MQVNKNNADNEPRIINDYADLIIEYLHQLGVQYVFGVPGGAKVSR